MESHILASPSGEEQKGATPLVELLITLLSVAIFGPYIYLARKHARQRKEIEAKISSKPKEDTSEALSIENVGLLGRISGLELGNSMYGKEVAQLKRELSEALTENEELVTKNEELELVNEEVTIANEEVTSANKELVSANKELKDTIKKNEDAWHINLVPSAQYVALHVEMQRIQDLLEEVKEDKVILTAQVEDLKNDTTTKGLREALASQTCRADELQVQLNTLTLRTDAIVGRTRLECGEQAAKTLDDMEAKHNEELACQERVRDAQLNRASEAREELEADNKRLYSQVEELQRKVDIEIANGDFKAHQVRVSFHETLRTEQAEHLEDFREEHYKHQTQLNEAREWLDIVNQQHETEMQEARTASTTQAQEHEAQMEKARQWMAALERQHAREMEQVKSADSTSDAFVALDEMAKTLERQKKEHEEALKQQEQDHKAKVQQVQKHMKQQMQMLEAASRNNKNMYEARLLEQEQKHDAVVQHHKEVLNYNMRVREYHIQRYRQLLALYKEKEETVERLSKELKESIWRQKAAEGGISSARTLLEKMVQDKQQDVKEAEQRNAQQQQDIEQREELFAQFERNRESNARLKSAYEKKISELQDQNTQLVQLEEMNATAFSAYRKLISELQDKNTDLETQAEAKDASILSLAREKNQLESSVRGSKAIQTAYCTSIGGKQNLRKEVDKLEAIEQSLTNEVESLRGGIQKATEDD